MNLYGFAAGDPVTYSDPFGLCKNEKGEEVSNDKCRDVSADEGKKIYGAAKASGQWTWTEGAEGQVPKNVCSNVGDCTDFVESAMRGAGMPSLDPRPGTSEYPGSTSYRALGADDTPQVGDVIIVGGHAGILTGEKSDGVLMAIQNGKHGVKTIKFAPGVNGLSGVQTIYRRLIPQ